MEHTKGARACGLVLAVFGIGTMSGCRTSASQDAAPDVRGTPGVERSDASLVVPPPTSQPRGSLREHYFDWDPPVPLRRAEQETDQQVAARVLQSDPLVKLLKIRPDVDGFVFFGGSKQGDPPKSLITFQQVYRWRGEVIAIPETFATVELTEEGSLAHVRTGFRSGVTLPNAPTTVDEAKATEIAIKDYEEKEKVSAVAIPHREPVFALHPLRGQTARRGDTLAYSILVKAMVDGAFSRPFMYRVDAFDGVILNRFQAWQE